MNESLTTNHQLEKLAKKFNIPLNAVVSKDQLNYMIPQKGGYIVNMEDSTEGDGSHWVSIWFNKIDEPALYFDSFGIDPPIAIMDFMNQWNSKCIFSTKEIQNINSGFCGQYCLLFLHQMSKNKGKLKNKYNNFINRFNDNRI